MTEAIAIKKVTWSVPKIFTHKDLKFFLLDEIRWKKEELEASENYTFSEKKYNFLLNEINNCMTFKELVNVLIRISDSSVVEISEIHKLY